MPSNFPASADTFDDADTIHGKKMDGTTDPNPPSATYHSDLLGGLGDAIEAIEGWLLGGEISFQALVGQTDPVLTLTTDGDPLDPGKIALSITKYDGTPAVHHLDDDGAFLLGRMSLSESGTFEIYSVDPTPGNNIFRFLNDGLALLTVQTPGAGYNTFVSSWDPGDITLILYGDSAQTADIFQVRDGNTDSVLFSVDANGTVPGMPVVRKFPFAFDTANILTGHTVYTPTSGEFLLDAWIEIETAWNGTTPKGDVGTFASDIYGWFQLGGTGPIVMSTVNTDTQFGDGLLDQRILPGVPVKITSGANPIKVCVSQNGTKTGANPGSTQGAAILYLVTVTPL